MTLSNQRSVGTLSGFLTTCFATNAQMEREVTRMEMLSSSHKFSIRSVFAKWVRMKSKSESRMGSLAMWRIACRHTKRDRLCTSGSSQAARRGRVPATLRRRTRRDSRKEMDLIDGMRSGILCIGILAANFRNVCLSLSASWLNSQVNLPRSPSLNVVTARIKMLFSKPYVKYCQ
ncbi:hypothetical protein F5888DRAFT_1732940 [Russula emetica]|nr:hypothetical protein F5888DRAFT_1732940 [Russula emetica]